MSCTFNEAIAEIYRVDLGRMRAGLCRQFASSPDVAIEDAIQEAFSVALDSRAVREGWQQGGQRRLAATLWTIAKRQLTHSYTRRQRLVALPVIEAGFDDRPRLESRLMVSRVMAMVPAAARRFGGRRAADLERALATRVLGGASDAGAALRTGARREQVNRARHWMLDALA